RRRRFEDVVESHAQLAQRGEIGTETRRRDDLVEPSELAVAIADTDAVRRRRQFGDTQDLLANGAALDERAHPRAERTARGQRVIRLAAVLRVGERTADDPGDARA